MSECVENCGRDAEEPNGMCSDCHGDVICRECGDRNDNGEGWDGLCGTCADRAYAAEMREEHV